MRALTLLAVFAFGCAPVIARPDRLETSCNVAATSASARWQENEVWGSYVHTKTYSVSGLSLYRGW